MIREVLGIPEAFRGPEAWWGPDTLCPSIMTKDNKKKEQGWYGDLNRSLEVSRSTTRFFAFQEQLSDDGVFTAAWRAVIPGPFVW